MRAPPATPRVWRLSTHLSALLVATTLLTLVVVGSLVLAYRLPAIEGETQAGLEREVEGLGRRLELLLGTAQTRLKLLQSLIDAAPPTQAAALLDDGVRTGLRFDALYQLSPAGKVRAVGLAGPWRARRGDLVGSDLSADGLFRAVRDGSAPQAVWSGRYTSVLTGARAVALAVRDDSGDVLLAEVSYEVLLQAVRIAAGRRSSAVWIADNHGAPIVDTEAVREIGQIDPRSWATARQEAQAEGRARSIVFSYAGQPRHAAMVHAAALDWYLVEHAPRGWNNPRVRQLLAAIGAVGGACGLTGLLIAPFWARRMTRPLLRIVDRAEQTMRRGASEGDWPRGPVDEFNRLARDLQAMSDALREREHKFLAIFNASPVPMAVVDLANGNRLQDVNEAWCVEMRRARAAVLGRTAVEIGLWSAEQRIAMLARLDRQRASGEVELLRGDGEPVAMQVFAQRVVLAAQDLMLWAMVDIGPMRRSEQQLRELNLQLESRVAQRTAALSASNAELQARLEQLRTAQDDLVQAEKMAALGELVAGVAHELNTPLGNGVMAISAMQDATRRLRQAMAGGLRRSDMQLVLDEVAQGTDIALRNLRRAADLVHSFKQVAVDRTSAQRRAFEISEVVHEMVVSLRPSIARTPYRIEVDVPDQGLRLDSYPGALGQILGNLIQNAVLHGFDGRAHGTVRISAGSEAAPSAERVWLRVDDDGRGIAPALLGRVFEPFMTTRAGRGGTGLGLHISQNAVVNLLGGVLEVQSTLGEGTCFTVRLPRRAPLVAAEGAARTAGAAGGPAPGV